MYRFFSFLSYLFHPVFVNFGIVVLFLFVHPYTASKMHGNARLLHMVILFVNLVLLPLLLMLFLKKRKLISSYQVPIQKERGVLYIMLGILFGITTYQIRKLTIRDFIPRNLFLIAIKSSYFKFNVINISFRSFGECHSITKGNSTVDHHFLGFRLYLPES